MEQFITLGISLGLGLLIGLQRERTEPFYGGIRTYPLVCLFGTFCGFLAVDAGGWPIAAGVLATFGTLAIANWLRREGREYESGQTTEMAALLTFAIGAYLPLGDRALAAVAAGLVVVLLQLKEPMHAFVRRMKPKDMSGLMQFVVVSLIVLPLLPNRTFGPFNVLNPFDIWRMVVLIVGLSFSGYLIYKFVAGTTSVVVSGVLGGLISSTATAVSYARRAAASPKAHAMAVTVILLASVISYLRVIMEVSIFAPSKLGVLLPPLIATVVWVGAIAGTAFAFLRGDQADMPEPENPAELKSAVLFGIIYAVITLAVAVVREYFGSASLYAVAIISGLTDMDAITLSLARAVEGNQLDPANAWRLILVASLSNLVFKGAAASFLGGRRFGLRLAPFFVAAIAGGLLVAWLWPNAWMVAIEKPPAP